MVVDKKFIKSSRKLIKSSRKPIKSTIGKFGNFDDLNSFASYYDIHYRPMLEELAYGESKLTDKHKTLLKFLLDDINKVIESNEIESACRPIKSSVNDNWRGVPGVKMIWHGEWSDPELEYNGKVLNYWEVENTMYERAKEDGIDAENDEAFNKYCQDYAYDVYEMFDIIESACHGKKKGKKKTVKSSQFNTFSSLFIRNNILVEGEECVIEINQNGKWEFVSLDNTPEGWSTKKKARTFKSEDEARKSALMRRLNNAGYSEEAGNLRIEKR